MIVHICNIEGAIGTYRNTGRERKLCGGSRTAVATVTVQAFAGYCGNNPIRSYPADPPVARICKIEGAIGTYCHTGRAKKLCSGGWTAIATVAKSPKPRYYGNDPITSHGGNDPIRSYPADPIIVIICNIEGAVVI